MRTRPVTVAAVLSALALFSAGAAHADVKAGVDAWTAGDYARAVAEWQGPAAGGDADALFNLAQAHRLGRGVPQDSLRAETLYARAAAKGHLKAADNYGLLMFQDGRREQAMPYVTAAAERGDPRAQYLLGIAHFNGDFAPRDYVRAYALLTLANAAGLPQAAPAIRQMDDFVALAQREQAQVLAGQMRADADARRTSAMAAADLGDGPPALVAISIPSAPPPARRPQSVTSGAIPPSSTVATEAAVLEATRATGTESPATAGADFARPGLASAATGQARVVAEVRTARADPPARAAPVATAGGPWKLQLGAFSIAGNAERLWTQLAGRPVLAGKSKMTAPAGRLTRLLAQGWPSQAAAQSACTTLKAAGQGCIVTR